MKESLNSLITNFIGIFNSFMEGIKTEAANPKKAIILAVVAMVGFQLLTLGKSSLLTYAIGLVSGLSIEQIVGLIVAIVLIKK